MMNNIPFSQMEGVLTQKRDLRENRCFITFFSAAKVSNTKAFIDRSRSVTLIDPMTRGLKVKTFLSASAANSCVTLIDPMTRGLKEEVKQNTWSIRLIGYTD